MMFTCSAKRSASTRIVRTRKGKSLRVDIHCHYLNPAVAAKIAPLDPTRHDPLFAFSNAATREVNAKQVQERGPMLTSIERRLADMDHMGIDVQAISPAPNQVIYWSEPQLGIELARMVNDRLAEIAATWPDRFVGLGTVPLQNVDLAVAELERCVKQLGLRAVELSQEDVFRHHRIRPAHAAPDGRPVRRGSRPPRHRLSVRHGGSRSAGPHREDPAARARRARDDRGRQCGAVAEDPEEKMIGMLRSALAATLLALLFTTCVQAQGKWVKLAPFPEPAEELLGVAAGGKL